MNSGINNDNIAENESYVHAFKLYFPALIQAVLSPENDDIEFRSLSLAILLQFQRLNSPALEAYIKSDRWTQTRLVVMLNAQFGHLIGEDKYFSDLDEVLYVLPLLEERHC